MHDKDLVVHLLLFLEGFLNALKDGIMIHYLFLLRFALSSMDSLEFS